MALGIIGIVIALAIFLYGAYKNVSVMWLAPLCGIIVAITNGLNPTDAFTGYYVGAVEENAATGVSADWRSLRYDHSNLPDRIPGRNLRKGTGRQRCCSVYRNHISRQICLHNK